MRDLNSTRFGLHMEWFCKSMWCRGVNLFEEHRFWRWCHVQGSQFTYISISTIEIVLCSLISVLHSIIRLLYHVSIYLSYRDTLLSYPLQTIFTVES